MGILSKLKALSDSNPIVWEHLVTLSKCKRKKIERRKRKKKKTRDKMKEKEKEEKRENELHKKWYPRNRIEYFSLK